MGSLNIFIIFLYVMTFYPDLSQANTFDVLSFGAVGNGYHDDSQAFMKAWNGACSSGHGGATMVVPGGKTYFLSPLEFNGPCKASSIQVQIDGTLVGPNHINGWKGCVYNTWIVFSFVDGLHVNGKGKLDGRGLLWWRTLDQYDHPEHDTMNPSWNEYNGGKECSRPTVLRFKSCNNLELRGLTHINPPNNHISIQTCKNVKISKLKITAPSDSPNTDGINIYSSTNVHINNSVISTGDDCVAISSGSSNIFVKGVLCGPGHGISVGSLGKDDSYATVEGVHVENCTFSETTNGVRIKTWQGGRGYAKDITFKDIHMNNVENSIIINQDYCNKKHDCSEESNAVQVSDVKYSNIFGTSSQKQAILLDCSDHVPCTNIVFDNVRITAGSKSEVVYSSCKNARGSCTSTYPKVPCLIIKGDRELVSLI